MITTQCEWMITSYFRVGFNCAAIMQGTHNIPHLI